MSIRRAFAAPHVLGGLLVALLIMVAALVAVARRDRHDYSAAQLVLRPTATDPGRRVQQLQTFVSGGVQGTFVEYLASFPVGDASLEVRPVSASRVIAVRVSRHRRPTPALENVLARALASQSRTVGGDWELRELAEPTPPRPAGPATPALLAMGAVVAAGAGLVTSLGIRARRRRTAHCPPEDAA